MLKGVVVANGRLHRKREMGVFGSGEEGTDRAMAKYYRSEGKTKTSRGQNQTPSNLARGRQEGSTVKKLSLTAPLT